MNFKKNDLNNKIFIGVVENVYDKLRKGRIQVRVQSVFNDIPLEHIPWAEPYRSLDGRSFTVPAIGKVVNIIFNNGNIYEPYYIYSENYNVNLQEKLNDMSDEDYENFTAFLYDHQTQFFKDNDGFTIDYLYNKFTISDDSINLELKNNSGVITLGSKSADQEIVLGTNFFKWMDKFMNELLKPTSLIGNIGSPILKPVIDNLIMEYKAMRNTFVSENVYVNDNMKIDILTRESNVNMHDVDYTINNEDLNSEIKPIKQITADELEKKKKCKKVNRISNDINNNINKTIEEKIAEKNKKEMDRMIQAESIEVGDPISGTYDLEVNNINDYAAVEFDEIDNEILKKTNVSDDPKYKPNTNKKFIINTDIEENDCDSYENTRENKVYGKYSTDANITDVDMSINVNNDIGEYVESGIEWRKCGAFFGAKSPYKYETLTSKVDPRLIDLISFLNIELKKWNNTYKIIGVGGARSIEASMMTGKKGEATVRAKLPELWKIIKKMRKKYNIKTCSARAMISNHVVGSAIDTKQWVNGDVYYFGNRRKNPYTKLMKIPGYKKAMLAALKKWEKENGVHPRWGGQWSCWKSEAHHFEINISKNEKINAIKEGWDKGKKWRIERNPD